MKRVLRAILAVSVLSLLVVAIAFAAEKKAGAKEPKSMTIKGELIDMGCYVGHGAKGAAHKECAMKCVAGGMPMGILTSDNKLYLATMNHDNPDAYNKMKEWAGDMVTVTGMVSSRHGTWAIDVSAAEPAATAASK